MSIPAPTLAPPPPVAPPKKGGFGCLGCGCAVLVVILLLFLGVVGGVGYFAYSGLRSLTSSDPTTIPTFDGGDEMYNAAMQKLSSFDHDRKAHLAASIHLNANEINTLIARQPFTTQNKIHAFVNLDNDRIRLQSSVPLGPLTHGIYQDRYLNTDVTFGITFASRDKAIDFEFDKFQLGNIDLPKEKLPQTQTQVTAAINGILQNNPDAKSFMDQVKTLQVKDGELVIEIE